ncbi:hypothetical protein [Nonlabens antarcticus]|uniref:hypothetical protein n=1 Tax=Nonlabens antarcticus TaxID=392714 RepID=UPI001890DB7E|nr:hypothetical protein [Nonlabens antarcticus]
MKQILFILVVFVTGSTYAQAQVRSSSDDRTMAEKIETLLIAFLSQEVELTADEAQKFWPVYNDIKEERDKLHSEKKRLMYDMAKNFDNVSDKEAQRYVDRMFDIEGKLNESNFEARNRKIIKVIGPKRFLNLKKAEREFRVKLIKEYGSRRRGNTP